MRRYHPIGPLMSGEGSRAVLGLALEEGLPPQPVVIVWAAPEQLRDPVLAERLFEDTKHAVGLEHPNILRVHGMVLLAGLPARVTAYADGEPLRRVLEVGQRLPPALSALVLADAARGVHHAHQKDREDGTPFVHGDLRPETLMVRFDGVCQVTGYAALGVAPREANGRRVPNRRRYNAPEQLLEGRDAVNVRTDVLLLGLVLHECLTGKIPFQDAPDPDEAALREALPPLPDDMPRALDAVVRKATAKRPEERYPSALAFHDALVAAVGELPSRAALAEHLSRLFPPDNEVRKARRQVIETGVTEALERLGMLPH
jgi:serine/threonine-protein kinase